MKGRLSKDENAARIAMLLTLARLHQLYRDEPSIDAKKYISNIENALFDLKYLVRKNKSAREQLRAAIRVAAHSIQFVIEVIFKRKKES